MDTFVVCFALGVALAWVCFGKLYYDAWRADRKRTRQLEQDHAATRRQLGYLK
jgi:uncharacterized membrane protein YciS (DUF1049 family)